MFNRINKFVQEQTSGDNSTNYQAKRDINITNIFVVNVDLDELKHYYSTIYEFHNSKGEEKFKELFGDEDLVKERENYKRKLKSFPPSNEASIEDYIRMANEIYRGEFGWSSSQVHKGKTLLLSAKEIKKITNKSTGGKVEKEEDLPEVGRDYLIDRDDDLRYIEEENLESKNIGGIIAVLETGAYWNPNLISTPEMLGFEKIDNEDSITSFLLNKTLSISDVKLINDTEQYKAKFTLINNISSTINCIVPKGQIFENKEFKKDTQNLAVEEDEYLKIEGNDSVPIEINALCLNQKFAPPNGGLGNITLFKVADSSFVNQKELWKIIEKINSDKKYK